MGNICCSNKEDFVLTEEWPEMSITKRQPISDGIKIASDYESDAEEHEY